MQLSQKHYVRIKAVLKVTSAHPGTRWKTMTPLTHSCSNNGVMQLGLLSSDAVLEDVKINVMSFVYILWQYVPHAVVNRI